jgi:mannose-6-phosphate isomerase-like protein (cupin superfamily)
MISKENMEHYKWGDDCDGWHLVQHPQLSIIQERMPPGTSEVKHFHRQSSQFFFVLSGIATLEIAGEREILQSHQGCTVSEGNPHCIFNEAEQDLEFLVVSQPPSHGDRVNC